jgi:hypothetical protein
VASGGKIVWDAVGTVVIKAVATKESLEDSRVVEKAYHIQARAVVPEFEGAEDGLTYVGAAHITLTSATEVCVCRGVAQTRQTCVGRCHEALM